MRPPIFGELTFLDIGIFHIKKGAACTAPFFYEHLAYQNLSTGLSYLRKR